MNQNMLLSNLINHQRQSEININELQQEEERNFSQMPMASNRHFERPRRVIYIVLDLFWMVVMCFSWFGITWISFVMDYYIKHLFMA